MVKSQSWTGNINRNRQTNENYFPSRKSTNSPQLLTSSIATGISSLDEVRSKSAKSSPDHVPLTDAGLSGHEKGHYSIRRGQKSNSDYNIVQISSMQNPPRTKLPNIKERHPNDPLIDLNNEGCSKNKEPPLTKVSILESFDPLIDGNTKSNTEHVVPLHDSVDVEKESNNTCKKLESKDENIDDG